MLRSDFKTGETVPGLTLETIFPSYLGNPLLPPIDAKITLSSFEASLTLSLKDLESS